MRAALLFSTALAFAGMALAKHKNTGKATPDDPSWPACDTPAGPPAGGNTKGEWTTACTVKDIELTSLLSSSSPVHASAYSFGVAPEEQTDDPSFWVSPDLGSCGFHYTDNDWAPASRPAGSTARTTTAATSGSAPSGRRPTTRSTFASSTPAVSLAAVRVNGDGPLILALLSDRRGQEHDVGLQRHCLYQVGLCRAGG